MARDRREAGGDPLLHVGDHGRSEGRAIHAPLDRVARVRRGPLRSARDLADRYGAAGRSDVPRQRVGRAVSRSDARREPRDAGAEARSHERDRSRERRESHDGARRSDRVARRARCARSERQLLADAQDARDRRFRVSALALRRSREAAHPRDPRVGHDGDEPDRHDLARGRTARGRAVGTAARGVAHAGALHAARRLEAARRRRRARPRRWKDAGQPVGARLRRHRVVFPRGRRLAGLPRRLLPHG